MVGERLTGFAGQTVERHSFGPYYEGQGNPYKDIQTADNYKVEQLEKRQRMLERRIRKTKREVMGMQEAFEIRSFFKHPHDCVCPVVSLAVSTKTIFPHSHLHSHLCIQFSCVPSPITVSLPNF